MDFKFITLAIICLLSFLTPNIYAEQCMDKDEEFYISFHPHLDAFWLNTDDQLKSITFRPEGFLYMMNQRNSKQIFNEMLGGLVSSPQRKYFVTEGVFLKDWYDYLPSESKEKVKQLIRNGQLQITNGGWVQNDEAVCYVDDIIDQYTYGHNWLYEEFGEITKIAWATDSFGHSHSQVAIQHLLGIQIQGIQRIDDRYIFRRKDGSLLQFYWSAVSDSNGLKYGGVFNHIRHFLHQFINYRQMSPNWIANDHSRILPIMKKLYRRNKFFRFVGNDFQEFNAADFDNLEAALKELNSQKKTCSTYKWGNPSDYFKWIKSQKQELIQVRQNDFLPNYDQDHYWSGYYTSNPQLKIICKDFSRITNLFRKLYMKNKVKGNQEDMDNVLKYADQLLSVMQHHDGISATSKYHIQELFKKRMRNSQNDLQNAIGKLSNRNDKFKCQFYKNGNKCQLPPDVSSKKYLTILHEGAPKIQKIQLKMPQGKYFQIQEDSQDNVFCPVTPSSSCTLVFQASLKSGQNSFTLNEIQKDSPIIVKQVQAGSLFFESSKFTVQVKNNINIKYSLKSGQFIALSLVRSSNSPSSTQTTTWNKFGDPINKNERRNPGIYIMSNTGTLSDINQATFQLLKVSEGKRYVKIVLKSRMAEIQLTINNKNISIIDIQMMFKPPSMQAADYFLKIDSSVTAKDQFYHDVNGYLVFKRKIGSRLDYQWKYKKQDKINANNYPMCSFAYVIQNQKKIVIFTDRAQGFTTFDHSMLVNVDRLTYDDYKGVGEGYLKMINNTFKFKIGLVSSSQNIQRLWQRQYDQALLGFLSDKPSSKKDVSFNKDLQLLKYTVFILNKNEFVVRIYNLGQKTSLKIPKYTSTSWKVPEIGLDLNFTDIRQSFANGIPLAERKVWKHIPGEINIFSAGSKDTASELYLQPLQIRSFRVNLKGTIKGPQLKKPQKQLVDIAIKQSKPLKPLENPFLKRCF